VWRVPRRPSVLASILLCSLCGPAFAADIRAAADAFIDGQAATRDTNFGAASTIRVRTSGPRIALVRFANLPPASSIAQPVELRMRVAAVNVPGDVIIRRVNSAWFESTVTWNARPPIDTQSWGVLTLSAADVGKVVSIDITTLATDWAADPAHNFGLAIVASPTFRTEVFFSSRESGPGPVLRVRQRTSDNIVTVGKSGADYTDPVTAARNAYAGDTWCQAPTFDALCQIRVSPGIFILQETLSLPAFVSLIGAGKGRTQLIARRGLEVAIAMAPGFDASAAIQDARVVNSQPSIARAVGVSVEGANASLQRVAVNVAGATAIAIDSTHAQDGLGVVHSEVSARGGQRAVGVLAPGRGFVIDSYGDLSVLATGGATESIGILDRAFDGTSVANVSVTAIGGMKAVAAELIGSEDAGTSINDSHFVALADGEAVALETDAGSGGLLSSTRVIARGSTSGTGALVGTSGPPGPPIVVSSLIAEGTTTGLQIGGESPYTIRGSHIVGSGTALRSGVAPDGAGQSLIENSFFEAPVSVEFSDQSPPAKLISDVLAGVRRIGANLTCTEVYDETYRLLDATCH
jgi:hypothetical protein